MKTSFNLTPSREQAIAMNPDSNVRPNDLKSTINVSGILSFCHWLDEQMYLALFGECSESLIEVCYVLHLLFLSEQGRCQGTQRAPELYSGICMHGEQLEN